MKSVKSIALALSLLTIAGAQAGWLDKVGGYLNQTPAPATAPAQLGQAGNAATSSTIATNLNTIKNTILSMVPTIQQAVATKNPAALMSLAPQGMSLVPLVQSTVSELKAHPNLKSAFASTINGILSTVNIPAIAAQVRTLGAGSNFFVSNGLSLLATALEQVPGLLQSALK